MDFVYEQYGLRAEPPALFGLFHNLLNLFYSAGHGRKIYEVRLGPARDYARERSLAHAGRAPEYHRTYFVAFDKSAQYLSLAQKVSLACKFRKGSRTKSCCKGQALLIFKKCGLFVHMASAPRHGKVKTAGNPANFCLFTPILYH